MNECCPSNVELKAGKFKNVQNIYFYNSFQKEYSFKLFFKTKFVL